MNTCKTCGGHVSRVDNYYLCEYCGNRWEIDASDDIHAVDRANAWSTLRNGDFEKAADLFENIITKEPENHEAYWGRALALGGIVYVTDMNENKKVPTCNNITEDSFINSNDVKKAISLAPANIAENYKSHAEYIENVRIEWLKKASKEPAYDVFISFKDSDRENGIERTQDSIDAQDLYNALVAEGYKVFFSRISLHDKISEQYEPYIYNAIKTSHVMIVFGEKAEYFNSVWIKNEWSRFKTRIANGEKHKNSLVVVYKNMNPGDLPAVLKSRQCLNVSDMTFLSDLTRHIGRVIEESKKSVHLEKIEITGGQMSKKASSLSVNSVKTREVGEGAIAETSISEKQSISLINTYLSEHQWQEVITLADDVLFNNPTCAEAVWCKLLATHRVCDATALVKILNIFQNKDYAVIEKVLNCASKNFAEEILIMLYDSVDTVNGATYSKILETILPFSFDKRQEKIENAFNSVISNSKYAPFKLLLNTLNSSDVDKYITYNYDYAVKTTNLIEKTECLNNILRIDEGNVNALKEIVNLDLQNSKPLSETTKDFETLLKYAKNPDKEVKEYLNRIIDTFKGENHCAFAKQLLRYYGAEISTLEKPLKTLCYRMIENGLFKEAEYFLNLILSFNQDDPETYWGICLMKIEARSENDISIKEKFLKDVPEFNRYLALVDEERRKHCIALSKNQEQQKNRRLQQELKQIIDNLKAAKDSLEQLENYKILEKRYRFMSLFSKLPIFLLVVTIILAAIAPNDPQFAGVCMIIYAIMSFVAGYYVSGANKYLSKKPDAFLGIILLAPIRLFYTVFCLILGWVALIFASSAKKRELINILSLAGNNNFSSIDEAIEKQKEKIKELENAKNEFSIH